MKFDPSISGFSRKDVRFIDNVLGGYALLNLGDFFCCTHGLFVVEGFIIVACGNWHFGNYFVFALLPLVMQLKHVLLSNKFLICWGPEPPCSASR